LPHDVDRESAQPQKLAGVVLGRLDHSLRENADMATFFDRTGVEKLPA